jgi:hypothetical protein
MQMQKGTMMTKKKKKKGHKPPPPKQQDSQPKPKPKGRQVPAEAKKPQPYFHVEIQGSTDAPAPPPSPPLKQRDPHQQAKEERWEEFHALEDYEKQIAMFYATLDDGLMDAENAFEMLNTIYFKVVDRHDHDRYIQMVNLLREREPEVYAHDSQYYIDNLINTAIVTGQTEPLPTLVEEMTEKIPSSIDYFLEMTDKLLYHGYGDLAANAMCKAWPAIKESQNIMNPSEIGYLAVDILLHAYLDNTEHPESNDPQLQENLAAITDIPVVPEKLARYIELAHGENLPQWSMSDFDLPKNGQKSSEEISDMQAEASQPANSPQSNLYELTIAFLGYLRHTENVPYVKGYLVRENIHQYILDRLAGTIKPHEPMFVPPNQRQSQKQPPVPSPSQIEHILCPDAGTIELFAMRFFSFIKAEYHKVAALFEVLPAWLRFLETMQLVDTEQHARTAQNLRSKVVATMHAWENSDDTTLRVNICNAWDITEEEAAASLAAAENNETKK